MHPSDADLCNLARDGDTGAFAVLFERHGNAVYNFCFRRVGDWSVAEDLLSIVFLVAWRRRDKMPSDKVLPWLYGVATNVVRNQRRAERRFRRALERVAESQRSPEFEEDAGARIGDEAAIQRVLSTLARLPQRQRDVFVLCAWMGLSYEDAAVALSVPVGTIRSRLGRAREQLRELEGDGGHIWSTTATIDEGGMP